MIVLNKLRELTLSAPTAVGRPSHLSAASGLVRVASFLYIVADDELHLGVFNTDDTNPGHLIRLFDGDLPDGPRKRRKHKPDLEALTQLPASADHPHGALLVLGSGSRPNRRTGAMLTLDANGAMQGAPRQIDLAPLFAPLDDAFAEPNIEGAVVIGGELRLFQRGNKAQTENAIVRFPLLAVLDSLMSGQDVTIMPSGIDRLDLGAIDGIPLCFTDAAALPNGDMVFTTVAEDTDDAYNDGPCAGSAVGVVGNNGRLLGMYPLDRQHKVEGVAARMDGDVIRLLLVTDADDATIPAGLFGAEVEISR